MRTVPTILAACAVVALPLLASAHGPGGPAGTATVQFNQCTEFVGVVPVDFTTARDKVPARYTLVSDAAGARLVIRVADCAAVKVGNLPARAGRVAQVGIIIVSPDGTATDPNTAINNYTLSYASDSPALVLALRAAGVPAALDAGLAYEINPPTGSQSEFYAAVSPELDGSPTYFLQGRVNTPVVGSSFLANWWRLNGNRETKMSTQIASITFDFASQVSFSTSRKNPIGQLLARNHVAGIPLSFRGAFPAGTMTTTVD